MVYQAGMPARLLLFVLVLILTTLSSLSFHMPVPTIIKNTRVQHPNPSTAVLFSATRTRVDQDSQNDNHNSQQMAAEYTVPVPVLDPSRRRWLTAWVAAAGTSALGGVLPAHAGLLQFPCTVLKNRYHFMRAGQSELERDNIYSTNPLFLTNRENQMTDTARQSVLPAVVEALKDREHNGLAAPTVAYHSLAANGMDTGDVLATSLQLGREKLLPEFTYLDPRGIGLWDSTAYDTTYPAVVALDSQYAGPQGSNPLSRPPPIEDGTPNETLGDQFVRLRQFLSLQESRTAGETILVIFPDATGPALLSSMIAGIPFNECHCLDYQPGELRLDITPQRVQQLYQVKKNDPQYLELLQQGQVQLKALQQQQQQESSLDSSDGSSSFISRKDQLAETNRQALEDQFLQEQAAKRQAQQEKEQALLQQRQEQDRIQQEKRKELQLQRQEKQQEQLRIQQEKRQEQRRRLQQQQQQSKDMTSSASTTTENQPTTSFLPATMGVSIVGISALMASGIMTDGSDESESTMESTIEPSPDSSSANATLVASKQPMAPDDNKSTAATTTGPTKTSIQSVPQQQESYENATAVTLVDTASEQETNNTKMSPSSMIGTKPPSLYSTPVAITAASATVPEAIQTSITQKRSNSIDEELEELQAAQDRFHASLMKSHDDDVKSSNDADAFVETKTTTADPITEELTILEKGQTAMNGYLDLEDDDDAWLRVVNEIRDESDD